MTEQEIDCKVAKLDNKNLIKRLNWDQTSLIWWLFRLLIHGLSLEHGDLKYFKVIFNNIWVISTSPKKYNQKFPKLNWEKISWGHLLKSQKYWNCKVFLCLKLATTTQLNSLFVLYFWSSSYCRYLMKLWNGPNSSITIKSLH